MNIRAEQMIALGGLLMDICSQTLAFGTMKGLRQELLSITLISTLEGYLNSSCRKRHLQHLTASGRRCMLSIGKVCQQTS